MAILWQKEIDGTRYEVRVAGHSRRLYTNGVFHSQFNPRQPVSGSIWDLLLIPAYFYSPGQIQRILVLGVGGGAVLRQFQHFIAPREIVGVELNPHHIYVARRFFNVTQDNIRLEQADAVQWVKSYNGEPFDMVVDDLFGEKNRQPVRAVEANARWFRQLCRISSKDGMIVTNFVSTAELKRCAYLTDDTIRNRFKCAFHFSAPHYENAIGVFLKSESTQRVLRQNLINVPQLNPTLKTSRLRFNVRRL